VAKRRLMPPTRGLSAGATACSGSPCSPGSYGSAGKAPLTLQPRETCTGGQQTHAESPSSCTVHPLQAHGGHGAACQSKHSQSDSSARLVCGVRACVWRWAGATRAEDALCYPCPVGSFSKSFTAGQAEPLRRERELDALPKHDSTRCLTCSSSIGSE
jgi:hypothetical protein